MMLTVELGPDDSSRSYDQAKFLQSSVSTDGNSFPVSRAQRRDSVAHLQLLAQSLQMNLNLRWRLQEVA